MALIRDSKDNQSKLNLEEITKNEAIAQQWEFIDEWTPRRDVFFTKYGGIFLGVLAGCVSFHATRFYRLKLKCRNYGYISSYMPATLFPAIASGYFHTNAITTSIILEDAECSVCTEIRSMVFQVGFGVLYSLFLGPLTGYTIANHFSTTRLPDVTKKPKDFFQFHQNISKRLYQKLPLLILISVLAPSLLTYLEYNEYYAVKEKMKAIEAELRARGIEV